MENRQEWPQHPHPPRHTQTLQHPQDRVQQLRSYYEDARTYLGIDEAKTIAGYIDELQGLGLDFINVSVGCVGALNALQGLGRDFINVSVVGAVCGTGLKA
eukprot:360988-Chlamydomonas_euryale.AAC.3